MTLTINLKKCASSEDSEDRRDLGDKTWGHSDLIVVKVT